MTIYEEQWCAALAESAAKATGEGVDLTVLYVITDTDDGKVAFHMGLESGAPAHVTPGKLPRGTKPDITVTAKDPVIRAIWAGERSRDEAFMAGDLKIEGAYQRWLDEVVPLFEAEPWRDSWSTSAS